MNNYYISYIFTTFNKIEYLKITLPYILNQLKENEELIIYDGNSNDGTKEYLDQILHNKKNIFYNSESDIGEAHGLNKCILVSNGKYIKVLSDDDAFDFETIRKACSYMDINLEIDWMGSNGFSYFYDKRNINFKNEEPYFIRWKQNRTPFLLTGLGYLFRKNSISKIGLFNTSVKIIDYEFSLRNLSNPKIKFALSILPFYVNIVNPNSNSVNMYSNLIKEYTDYQIFYKANNKGSIYLKQLKMFLYLKKYQLKSNFLINKNSNTKFHFQNIYESSIKFLNEHNSNYQLQILI